VSQTLPQKAESNAEAAAWREYRAAALAMRKRPTHENARKAVLSWKRFFDEVMREEQQ